ncbi:MAG TPA: hypothetical protein VMR99_00585 [Candidatus Paceibacterota bacterium]|nr:hypothetical protein [Candidatus Paceibacterota bacterium]
MSKTGTMILWIVLAVIIIGGGIWWWVASQSGTPAAVNNTMPPNGTSTSGSTAVASGTSYPPGDSDQSIGQDMTDLNTQMNGLSSDNASVTQSLSDQPVSQTQ